MNKSAFHNLCRLLSLFVCIICLWSLTFVLYCFIGESDERGQFGDMFGAANALFSGLAFAGLIITLDLQKKELSLQRKELEQTRGEFVMQNSTLKRQRFENTFFHLLSLYQNITDNFEYICPDSADAFETKGRGAFKKFYLEKNNFDNTFGVIGFLQNHDVKSFKIYPDITVFNHYFHYFDGIVAYIDNSDLIEKKEKYQYTVMLRNTLSDSERYLLFYHYATNDGWYKLMAEEYALFCDMDPSGLAKAEHYGLFSKEAYNYYPV